MTSELESVRADIDAIDRQIVTLIAERQGRVEAAGRLKSDRAAVRAPSRVESVIEKVRGLAEEAGADPTVVEQTYRSMIAAFIELELAVHEREVSSET